MPAVLPTGGIIVTPARLIPPAEPNGGGVIVFEPDAKLWSVMHAGEVTLVVEVNTSVPTTSPVY